MFLGCPRKVRFALCGVSNSVKALWTLSRVLLIFANHNEGILEVFAHF